MRAHCSVTVIQMHIRVKTGQRGTWSGAHLMTGSRGFRASRRCQPSMSRSWRLSVAAWCESTRFLSASARDASHAASSSSSCFLACTVTKKRVFVARRKGLAMFNEAR